MPAAGFAIQIFGKIKDYIKRKKKIQFYQPGFEEYYPIGEGSMEKMSQNLEGLCDEWELDKEVLFYQSSIHRTTLQILGHFSILPSDRIIFSKPSLHLKLYFFFFFFYVIFYFPNLYCKTSSRQTPSLITYTSANPKDSPFSQSLKSGHQHENEVT